MALYDISLDASLAASSEANSPFADDTYIAFSGSTLTSPQTITNTPKTDTSAATAGKGGSANVAQDASALGSPDSGSSSGSSRLSPVVWLVIGIAASIFLTKVVKI